MERYRKDIQGLLSFLADSPTAFHTVDNFARMLREHGFSCFQNGSAGISNQAGHTIPCEMDLASLLSDRILAGRLQF